jgi:hypothetical protein
MGYSLIHYLKNLPLQYYLEGGFIQIRGPTISIHYHPIGHKNSCCALGLKRVCGRSLAESV